MSLVGLLILTVIQKILQKHKERHKFFLCAYLGGRLKTTAEADSESLQAKWIRDLKTLTLRAKDIIPLIEKGEGGLHAQSTFVLLNRYFHVI